MFHDSRAVQRSARLRKTGVAPAAPITPHWGRTECLARLRGLTDLDTLDMVGERITETGLVHLEGLAHLKLLMVYSKQVTPDGVDALKAVLPELIVIP